MNREPIARAVTLALMENGIGPEADGMHQWRCDYPDRYGPCDCFAETVTDVTTAVLAAIRDELTTDRAIESES